MELNNREWALLFWMATALVFVLVTPKFHEVRKSLKQVFITFISRPIMSVLVLMMVYAGFLIVVLYKLGLWDESQSKNTLIWFVSIAGLSLFKLDKYRKDQKFYVDFSLASFKLLAVIYFILRFYSFPVSIELVVVPILFFLSMMLGVAQTNSKFQIVEKLVTNIFSIYGLILIAFTGYMLATDFRSFGTMATIYDFFVPAVLTVLYIPFILFLLVYTSYEVLPQRLKFAVKEPKLLKYTKYYAFIRFRFRYKLLERWLKSLVYLNIETFADVKKSINDIFVLVDIEKSPPPIKTNKGWSPYDAVDFLKEAGIVAENYHPSLPNEWFASSSYVKTSEERKHRNTVVYYVNGSAQIADCLELHLNVSSIDSIESAHIQLLSYAKILFLNALDREITSELEEAILQGIPTNIRIGIFEVILKKVGWSNIKIPGYDLEFCIRLPKE